MEAPKNIGVYLLTAVDFQLEYKIYGNALHKPYLFVFHGFDRDFTDFEKLPSLYLHYNVVGVNIFFHGSSSFHGAELTKSQWLNIFTRLLGEIGNYTYSLAGFSMGGKFVLSLLENPSIKPKSVFLIAADGLRIHPGYYFATHTVLGRKLSERFARKPGIVLTVIKKVIRMGLVGEKMAKFILLYTEEEDMRQKVVSVWRVFKPIKPQLQKVAENINRLNISVHLIFGDYDFIIPKKDSFKLKSLASKNVIVHSVDCGHSMFNEKTNALIANICAQKKEP